ncbi:MYXO-CTERM domain-containing protein [Nocardioides albertanoniae]|uniref:MYXO-CTERM domain-containing protein n=1 Tax=Nocardioides albertanoniae TaxID=1175486 RepID=A0A543A8T3_9ACTN|nr:hypothetical protein [Nocardioides albertanoniae]TQL69008.1 MYXO-CTERM domain-containing protein [Nocardioides albertanoniae]
MRWQRLAPVGLLLATLGLLGLGVVGPPTADGGPRLSPGIPVLLAAAAVIWWWQRRLGAVLGLLAVAVVVVASVGAGLGPDLIGERGVPVAVARWVQAVGLAVAAYALVRRLVVGSPAAVSERPRRDRSHVLQIVGLLALSAIGAELLAAYGDNTGDPGGIAFALVFFGALYGAPALLARELARRLGWGWPSMLLLFAALGTAEAALIDQSLFSVDYYGYEGWEANREPTLISALGFSGYNAYSFIVGHIIFSFGAPVALAEAWVPVRARKPWLGPVGTVFAAVAYIVAVLFIVSDPESQSGSPSQLIGSAGVVGVLVLVAALVGRRRRTVETPHGSRELSLWVVFAVALVCAVIPDLVPATWLGVGISVTTMAVFGAAILLASRHRVWTLRHAAAVAAGCLCVRGLMAFTYFPLLGDVAPGPKYAHNVVMLGAVLLAAWVAVRGSRAESALPALRPRWRVR